MRLLITGAAGEVGTRLLDALAAADSPLRPDRILAADRVASPVPARFDRLSLAVRVVDVAEADLPALVAAERIDAVVHAAALTGAAAEIDRNATLALNFDALRRLADALAGGPAGRAGRLVLASSVAAVGRFDGPIAGEDSPHAPVGAYGLSKALGELFSREVRRRGNLDARVLRLPTLLVRRGPRRHAPSTGYLSDLVKAWRGNTAFCAPVPPRFPVAVAHGAQAGRALACALALEPGAWGGDAVANLPAVAVTAEDLVAALQTAEGREGPPVTFAPDPDLLARVGGWPRALSSRLADRLVPPSALDREALLAGIVADPDR